MTPRPGRARLAALTLIVPMLAGCAAGAAKPPAAQPASDGITLLTAVFPDTLNPVAGFGAQGNGNINEGLLTLSGAPDALPDLIPALAAEAPGISADALSWTVKLRRDVRFTDGSTLDAADVVATYRAVADASSASPIAGDLVNLASVKAVDPLTVRFTLHEPQVSFDTALMVGIAPSETLADPGPVTGSALNRSPVGTGPYTVESFTSERLVLAANPGFRDGAPQVKRITYVLGADDNSRAQRMAAGEFDGTVLPPRLAETFAKNPDFEVIAATSADWRGLSLPAGNPVTADPAMALALNLGIDRQSIIDAVLLGRGRPASTFIPPQYGENHNPDAVFAHDPARAGRILDEAGWVPGADGIRVKDGVRAAFTLLYSPGDMLRRDLSAAFASEVLQLGIDVSIEGADFDVAAPRAEHDAIMYGGGETPYDVDTQVYRMLHSSYPAAGAYYDNPSRYADPAMDAALHTGRTALDPAVRAAAYRKVAELYVADPSMVLIAFVDHTYVQKAGIESAWNTTGTLLEPHEHGTAWGPWVDIAAWTRKQ